jgi:hypothetical protein
MGTNNTTENTFTPCIRTRLYLDEIEEGFWTVLPARVNYGDSFFIDEFIDKEQIEKNSKYSFVDGDILYCCSQSWDKDEKGVFQQVNLVQDLNSREAFYLNPEATKLRFLVEKLLKIYKKF